MANNLSINTGAPRNVTGHVVSGALAAGALAAAVNYNKYKKGEATKNEAINNSIKLSAQGGIATGSAIAAANYLGNGSVVKMLTAVSVGAMGIYAVEKLSEKLSKKELIEEEK
ncbi:magnetosome protein MamC [Halarcobacter ebronensis]|uniref:Ammonium transporter n=1 Tax=Halarcobacter ebronensis TaxID=1462615 RepID=A0A4Q1AK15_9BACT|nr:magnetosome protein MamC [Halarcobacter ebronensis]QKF81291.1 hypothetical protein AEBR_0791 [Halarcobacter ebronensis]RXK04856.1 hypothetical protein CRV07_09710 [Halarcobacter ebronensis]